MNIVLEAFLNALQLLWTLDESLLQIVALTLRVTGSALFLAIVIGVPLGVIFGLRAQTTAVGCFMPLIYTGMGLPPVVVGLFVYLLLSNQGPLGDLQWLFTPTAMIAAQLILALPLVVGLTITAVRGVNPELHLQIRSLGATQRQLAWAILSEARLGMIAAVVAAFGAIISEVGAVMLVGGNIAGETRVLTTAIVLETRKGDFALALALGIILLTLAFTANLVLYGIQQRGEMA
jgi:tungstate transport system permease protein